MLAFRHMLQQLLTGNELAGDTLSSQEEGIAAIAAAREKYSLKLVDVNSTNKGSPAGGVQSFSAMVVVGDGEVLAMSCGFFGFPCFSCAHRGITLVNCCAQHVNVRCKRCCFASKVNSSSCSLPRWVLYLHLHLTQGFLID